MDWGNSLTFQSAAFNGDRPLLPGGVYGADSDEVVCVGLQPCEQYTALPPGQRHRAYVSVWDWPELHPVPLYLS